MDPDEKSHYLRLIKAVEAMPALPTAVVHPCDEVSLAGALQAAAWCTAAHASARQCSSTGRLTL
jgi:hypothetical protein